VTGGTGVAEEEFGAFDLERVRGRWGGRKGRTREEGGEGEGGKVELMRLPQG
jgi:hypothetical protein